MLGPCKFPDMGTVSQSEAGPATRSLTVRRSSADKDREGEGCGERTVRLARCVHVRGGISPLPLSPSFLYSPISCNTANLGYPALPSTTTSNPPGQLITGSSFVCYNCRHIIAKVNHDTLCLSAEADYNFLLWDFNWSY